MSQSDLPASFQAGISRGNFPPYRLWSILLRRKKCLVPMQIVAQHPGKKEKIDFLEVTHPDIRMALQHLVKPGRTTAHRANSNEGRESPIAGAIAASDVLYSVRYQRCLLFSLAARHKFLPAPLALGAMQMMYLNLPATG